MFSNPIPAKDNLNLVLGDGSCELYIGLGRTWAELSDF